MRRQISILLAALLVLTLLVGCGGSGSAKPAATGYAYDTDASTAPEAPMEQDSKFNITAVVADDTAQSQRGLNPLWIDRILAQCQIGANFAMEVFLRTEM